MCFTLIHTGSQQTLAVDKPCPQDFRQKREQQVAWDLRKATTQPLDQSVRRRWPEFGPPSTCCRSSEPLLVGYWSSFDVKHIFSDSSSFGPSLYYHVACWIGIFQRCFQKEKHPPLVCRKKYRDLRWDCGVGEFHHLAIEPRPWCPLVPIAIAEMKLYGPYRILVSSSSVNNEL